MSPARCLVSPENSTCPHPEVTSKEPADWPLRQCQVCPGSQPARVTACPGHSLPGSRPFECTRGCSRGPRGAAIRQRLRGLAIHSDVKSGEGEIRTPGTLRYAGFQDQCIRPLCHLSGWSVRWMTSRNPMRIETRPDVRPEPSEFPGTQRVLQHRFSSAAAITTRQAGHDTSEMYLRKVPGIGFLNLDSRYLQDIRSFRVCP